MRSARSALHRLRDRSSVLGRALGRNAQSEYAALHWKIAYRDLAAVRLDRLLDNCQAQPEASAILATLHERFGQSAAKGEVHQQISSIIGPQAAAEVEIVLARAHRPEVGIVATVISVGTLLFSADTALVELKSGLDEIWSVKAQARRWYWNYLRARLLAIALILALGLLLLASLLFSAALGALAALSRGIFIVGMVLRSTNSLISFGLAVLLFAIVYKVLPSVRLAWKDVAAGAVITAVLFIVGKYGIELYLGSSTIASTYGAAGSVIVVLVWVYYSAQVFLFGAELTRGYAYRFGSRRGRTQPGAYREHQ